MSANYTIKHLRHFFLGVEVCFPTPVRLLPPANLASVRRVSYRLSNFLFSLPFPIYSRALSDARDNSSLFVIKGARLDGIEHGLSRMDASSSLRDPALGAMRDRRVSNQFETDFPDSRKGMGGKVKAMACRHAHLLLQGMARLTRGSKESSRDGKVGVHVRVRTE